VKVFSREDTKVTKSRWESGSGAGGGVAADPVTIEAPVDAA